jgi:hypothetical protein
MKAFARIARLERLLRTPVHGWVYMMPDGTERVLSWKQALKGFSDASSRVDSVEARIVRSAVADNNESLILKLLFAVLHPVDTTLS